MMTMLKRIVCLMVSCVFISMVCIPAAHADNTSGSIDLNVQPSLAEPRKMARAGGLTDETNIPYGAVITRTENGYKWHTGTQYGFKYCFKAIEKETGNPVVMKYSWGDWVSLALYNSKQDSQGRIIVPIEQTSTPGEYCYEYNDGVVYADGWRSWDSPTTNYSLIDSAYDGNHYVSVPPLWCKQDMNYGLMISCKSYDEKYNDDFIIGNDGLINTIYFHAEPEHKILSSFPITGEYALPIVISLVLIAGISMVFIHRYGRKHNG